MGAPLHHPKETPQHGPSKVMFTPASGWGYTNAISAARALGPNRWERSSFATEAKGTQSYGDFPSENVLPPRKREPRFFMSFSFCPKPAVFPRAFARLLPDAAGPHPTPSRRSSGAAPSPTSMAPSWEPWLRMGPDRECPKGTESSRLGAQSESRAGEPQAHRPRNPQLCCFQG